MATGRKQFLHGGEENSCSIEPNLVGSILIEVLENKFIYKFMLRPKKKENKFM